MKLWLSGLALLVASASVQAGNYRIVQSPTQKLDVWIDNIKDNTVQSWCSSQLSLRIVANGDKKISVLKSFMPRLGTLLESQCAPLKLVHWQYNDPNGNIIAQGTASKSSDWAAVEAPQAALETATSSPLMTRAEDLSPVADRTPWLEFTLQDGCHLRTFWQGGSNAPALFIPAKGDGKCEKGGWLNGQSEVVKVTASGQQKIAMTFVHGFPVIGLNKNVDADNLLITTVNNERMVISDGRSLQSWLILPYDASRNGWVADGTVAVEMPRDLASDDQRLRARIDEVRKVWSPWLMSGTSLNIKLVDALHAQLRDPAAGAYRTLK